MARQTANSHNQAWFLCCEVEQLNPTQLRVYDKLVESHSAGKITTREAYNAFKYYKIPAMRVCDIPY